MSLFSRISLYSLTTVFILLSLPVRATTYQVGPGRQYKTLQEVTLLLLPGDLVTVDGGVTYPGGVTLSGSGQPGRGVITLRGIRVNGTRPGLFGIAAQGGTVLRVLGSHYVIEGFDMTTGGDLRATRCFYNVGDDVTLRDSVVHDCQCTGVSGADASGSLTLDHVEVCRCGNGLFAHQIYVGSGLAQYPRAVFRMQYCYVHDGAGGNNVKSRVTLNQIAYNWIESAAFHELDLVGPDPKSQEVPPGGIHCDADIVGNVLIVGENSRGTVARLGSDGTGVSRGRYRFAYNTVIVRASPAAAFGLFWLKGEVDSVLMWNNVFWSEPGPLKLVRQEPGPPPIMAGDGNWLPTATTYAPPAWKAIRGADPGFQNAPAADYRPAAGSPLIAAGCVPPGGISATMIPPVRNLAPAQPRPASRQKDIGALPPASPVAADQAGTQ
jgi:hypothetical protein